MLPGDIFLAARANTDMGKVLAFLLFLLHVMNQRLSNDFGNTALSSFANALMSPSIVSSAKMVVCFMAFFESGTWEKLYPPYAADSSDRTTGAGTSKPYWINTR